jgi:cell wall-associated NlpC family hydrolase
MALTCITPTGDILGNPAELDIISNSDSQLLFGETFEVEEDHGAYVYGYSRLDGYKGSVERESLVENFPITNAHVISKCAHIYPAPNFKSRPTQTIPFFSRLCLTGERQDGFAKLCDKKWVFETHVRQDKELGSENRLAEVALGFEGCPYLYGGRSPWGLDCSALVQLAMMACGYDCPARDSKDQQSSIGQDADAEDLRKNDIVFFKGHVGIMLDEAHIINATSRHMQTVIENVRDLEKIYKGITRIARL